MKNAAVDVYKYAKSADGMNYRLYVPEGRSEAQLASITTPTWFVQSKADTVLPPAVNSIRAHNLIKGSLLSLYDTVTWDGVTYNGHWSWIYVANNDPMINGKHVWQWMAKQHVNNGH